jgi:uncharacterized protein
MKLPFLDRKQELDRLRRALAGTEPVFLVVYGRRRCGKSTLLKQVARAEDCLYMADQQESRPQIQALAVQIAQRHSQFAAATYPSWESLLRSYNAQAVVGSTLFLDEFPYLVQSAPDLPSVLQKFLDTVPERRFSLVICGSSQRMMQGLVLEAGAPLYGRAQEILKVRPLPPGWIQEAFSGNAQGAVEAFAVWGGIPRYWELARGYPSLPTAIKELVLDRNGPLHEEPMRLLLDDQRSAVQSASILNLIANGCHRLSEIAARLGKPAGSLTRPLSNLIDLGLVRRVLPYGENSRSTKRTLYQLEDPFLGFYYRFVHPHWSELEWGIMKLAEAELKTGFPFQVSIVWEELARQSVPWSNLGGYSWGQASRWWGPGTAGRNLELDVVAESIDKKAVLIGEVKWSKKTDTDSLLNQMNQKISAFPLVRGRPVVKVLWLRQHQAEPSGCIVQLPETTLELLR